MSTTCSLKFVSVFLSPIDIDTSDALLTDALHLNFASHAEPKTHVRNTLGHNTSPFSEYTAGRDVDVFYFSGQKRARRRLSDVSRTTSISLEVICWNKERRRGKHVWYLVPF